MEYHGPTKYVAEWPCGLVPSQMKGLKMNRTGLLFALLIAFVHLQAQKPLNKTNLADKYHPENGLIVNYIWNTEKELLVTVGGETEGLKGALLNYKSWKNKSPVSSSVIAPDCYQNVCTFRFKLNDDSSEGIMILKFDFEEQDATYYYEVYPSESMEQRPLLVNDQGSPIVAGYFKIDDELAVSSNNKESKQVYIHHYSKTFHYADPPTRVKGIADKELTVDSIFVVATGKKLVFQSPGLYFMQTDPSGNTGYAYRVERGPYPNYNLLEELSRCMRYITTNDEWKKLDTPDLTKAVFDEVWIKMAGNELGARKAIREYFRRITAANKYFTSYKEGWKTDMGMIYTIFGPPDEVNIRKNYEVWRYKETIHHDEMEFDFKKLKNPFSNRHYTLIRDDSYGRDWYRTVDMVRKGMDR